MKNWYRKSLNGSRSLMRFGLVALLLSSQSLLADDDLSKDLDSLGGNKALIKRARELDPRNRTRIVQRRLVDRRNRLELGLNYGTVAGGDSYVDSRQFGGQIEYHITPRFSLGVRYYESYNELTNQGRELFDRAERERQRYGVQGDIVEVGYAIDTTMGTFSYYPVYGKLNFFDLSVVQFDLYTLLGYGTVNTNTGSSPTYTLGAGLGFWLNQHMSTRLEARYQRYNDEVYTGERSLDLMILSVSLGLLL